MEMRAEFNRPWAGFLAANRGAGYPYDSHYLEDDKQGSFVIPTIQSSTVQYVDGDCRSPEED